LPSDSAFVAGDAGKEAASLIGDPDVNPQDRRSTKGRRSVLEDGLSQAHFGGRKQGMSLTARDLHRKLPFYE